MVCDLADTYNDRFAALVRKGLRREGIRRGVTAVFSPELTSHSSLVVLAGDQRQKFKRSYYGTISYIPALFGLNVAAHIINDVVQGPMAGGRAKSKVPRPVLGRPQHRARTAHEASGDDDSGSSSDGSSGSGIGSSGSDTMGSSSRSSRGGHDLMPSLLTASGAAAVAPTRQQQQEEGLADEGRQGVSGAASDAAAARLHHHQRLTHEEAVSAGEGFEGDGI